jgi:hypothetical protein
MPVSVTPLQVSKAHSTQRMKNVCHNRTVLCAVALLLKYITHSAQAHTD